MKQKKQRNKKFNPTSYTIVGERMIRITPGQLRNILAYRKKMGDPVQELSLEDMIEAEETEAEKYDLDEKNEDDY